MISYYLHTDDYPLVKMKVTDYKDNVFIGIAPTKDGARAVVLYKMHNIKKNILEKMLKQELSYEVNKKICMVIPYIIYEKSNISLKKCSNYDMLLALNNI